MCFTDADTYTDKHWEQTFWEDLDDPEYEPAESGRIDWTVKNVRGTRQKPSRELIRRSPAQLIGGFWWRMKLFPRGDQTSQLSVYIECSPRPWDDDEGDEDEDDEEEEPEEGENGEGSDTEIETSGDAAGDDQIVVDASEGSATPAVHETESAPREAPEPPTIVDALPWEVAAQFGVVLYNPAEPRVQHSFKEKHQFWNGYDDFGRRRFHGPWDHIHIRRSGERQALLRNDTLSLSAYIRIVKDPTGSLWWSQRDEGPGWNNLAKTGLKGLYTNMNSEGFFTAGMAAWLHLAPFQDMVSEFQVPDAKKEPYARPKPLFAALQRVLYSTFEHKPSAHTVEMTPIVQALKWYGIDLKPKIDTLEAWEIIKRKLEQEAQGTPTQARLLELFGSAALSKGSVGDGNSDLEQQANTNLEFAYPSIRLPAKDGGNVQDKLTKILNGVTSADSLVVRSAPELLQIELERQVFDDTVRKWKKVNDRVILNEHLTFSKEHVDRDSDLKYSLYGMIVHRGALQSGLYYLVVRPGGPRTKWFRFYGEQDGYQVQSVTRKRAIYEHEGFEEGKCDEDTAAVAYLAMYVRDDVFAGIEGKLGFIARWLGQYIPCRVPRATFGGD